MHIDSLEIKNLRHIESLTVDFSKFKKKSGWHVFLGENGSGKSSLLKSIALLMCGPSKISAAHINLPGMVGRVSPQLAINGKISWEKDYDSWRQGRHPDGSQIGAELTLLKDGTVKGKGRSYGKSKESELKLERNLWGDQPGWFSTGFGPQRRFMGGGAESARVEKLYPKLGRHLTLFSEEYCLIETKDWLYQLKFTEMERKLSNKQLSGPSTLEKIKNFINNNKLLPLDTSFVDIIEGEAVFNDGNNTEVILSELSDGYRSILSITFEIIRQALLAYKDKNIFDSDYSKIICTGVVLIDEIDSHLHPKWQREIGPWLCKHFPNIQFLVTTHSTFICQNAINGSIWKLPQPGSNEEFYQITGKELNQLIYGDASSALETEAFGLTSNKSELSLAKAEKQADKNLAEMRENLKKSKKL